MSRPARTHRDFSLYRFITHGMWEINIAELPFFRARALWLCRRLSVIVNGFLQDKCMLRASALAYTTVLSIVPFLAVVFAISKGLGLQNSETLRFLLLNASAGNAGAVDLLLQYVNNTNVTTLGVIGVAMLLVTVISLMGNIEAAFNTVWNVKKGRTLWRKFTDFFSIVLVAPVLIGVAVSLSVTMQSDRIVQGLLSIEAVNYVYIQLLQFLPTFLIWFLLFFAYAFIPNTRVQAKSAFVGGLVGVVLWKSVESLYISYQIGANNYNAIYGGFAQLPLFLIWVYLSWVIVLVGVEVSYAIQYAATEEDKLLADKTSCYEKSMLAMAVMVALAKNYEQKQGAVSVKALSKELQLTSLLITDVLQTMEHAGFTAKVDAENSAYILAQPASAVRVSDVLAVIMRAHPDRVVQYSLHESPQAIEAVENLYSALSDSEADRVLADFI